MVRGKLLSLREEDFVMAGKIAGATAAKIIPGHLVPSFLSYVTVALIQRTFDDPGRDRAELFRPGAAAAGGELGRAAERGAEHPHPRLGALAADSGLFVIVAVLAFNFVGDGLRDAADPYAR